MHATPSSTVVVGVRAVLVGHGDRRHLTAPCWQLREPSRSHYGRWHLRRPLLDVIPLLLLLKLLQLLLMQLLFEYLLLLQHMLWMHLMLLLLLLKLLNDLLMLLLLSLLMGRKQRMDGRRLRLVRRGCIGTTIPVSFSFISVRLHTSSRLFAIL